MFSTQELIEIVESNEHGYSVDEIIKNAERYLISKDNRYETEDYYRNISYKCESEEIYGCFDYWDYDRINALSLIFQIRPILKLYTEEFVEEIAKLLIELNIKELEFYNEKRKNEHDTIEKCLNDFELDGWCYNHVKFDIDHEEIKNKYPLMVKILSFK